MAKKKICNCPTEKHPIDATSLSDKTQKWFGAGKKIHKSDCVLNPDPPEPAIDAALLKKAGKEIAKALEDNSYWASGTSIKSISTGIHPAPDGWRTYWDYKPKYVSYESYRESGGSNYDTVGALVKENKELKARIERLEEIVLGVLEQEEAHDRQTDRIDGHGRAASGL